MKVVKLGEDLVSSLKAVLQKSVEGVVRMAKVFEVQLMES